jgi:hypothetical protein
MVCNPGERGNVRKTIILLLFLSIVVGTTTAHSFEFCLPYELDLTKEQKLAAMNIGAFVFITAWGAAFWDYGQRTPHSGNEGWFEQDTDEGGADKLGHMFTNIYVTEGFSYFYERWGFEHNTAALYGALSSFAIMAYTEFGDSFSDYGFSYEDFLMNTVGSIVGYLRYRYPEFSRKVDFRIEYIPNVEESDIFTDYEHQKFLMAVKLNGFDFLRNNIFLKYLELQVGYYTRGYADDESTKHRYVYGAVGLNLSKLFTDVCFPRFAKIFNYYQVPYTYVPYKHDL